MLLTGLVQNNLANKSVWLLNNLFFLFRYGFVSFLDNVDVQKIVEVSSLSKLSEKVDMWRLETMFRETQVVYCEK